ncbi:MAG: GNAT family N-acetyltransferase [Candidatus Fermentibacteraceae bacterium]|nr:GNAT family N-acetyltransferase [Candidatus Fermentibacteraceae bacterium]
MKKNIILEIYESHHAQTVATMWAESREGWPPGFLGASEFTAESVEMEEQSSGKLFTVLALEGDRVVGFCRTTPYGGEPDAAYVALVNVVPDLHGKKIGKRLLLDAVERTAEKGYYRIDLHTWPANLKAMPLYKKTGFFWVPDTMVYMQNYMPFMIGRPEFREFLDGESWYDVFERELEGEPDEQRTVSGREIFKYRFVIKDRFFEAVFDRRGRILSGINAPGLIASIEREEGKIFFGREIGITLAGDSLPFNIDMKSHEYLSAPSSVTLDEATSGFFVVHEPVAVPVPERDRSPRVSAVIPGENSLEIGLGIRAEEPVSLLSPPVRRIRQDQSELELDLKILADVDSVTVLTSLNGENFQEKKFVLEESIFQRIRIPLPELSGGVHELAIRFKLFDQCGAEEILILVCGPFTGIPESRITRKSAVIIGRDISVEVARTGAWAAIWGRSMDDRPSRLGGFRLYAGPPYWNSDLPHQLYDFKLDGNVIHASTVWPTRPGMKHESWFRLDHAGFIAAGNSVSNGTDSIQKIKFMTTWGGGHLFESQCDAIPFKNGIYTGRRIYNQIPDYEEDLPRKVDDLGAPWFAISGENRSMMVYFAGWSGIHYNKPETPEIVIEPGDAIESPVFKMLVLDGDFDCLFRGAQSLGWELGETEKRFGFFKHNITPVMRDGAEVQLSHHLLGKRKAAITLDGKVLSEGPVLKGTSISAEITGHGFHDVGLVLAEREIIYPVKIIPEAEKSIELTEDDGILTLSNGRMKALIDPTEFGHVFSLKLDDVEFLMSSHPGPSDFAWEKPWFGGIIPRVNASGEKPFRLDTLKPEWSKFELETDGLTEHGWELSWTIDHKRYGSLLLIWRVSMLPGVPVIRTTFCPEALHEAYLGGEFDVRGFLSPGGEHENAVLSYQNEPLLRQGRKHAGSWSCVGDWARVETPEEGFVEVYSLKKGLLFSEDYAEHGCHLTVFSSHDKKNEVEMLWLFGASEDDDRLSKIFRKHLGSRA